MKKYEGLNDDVLKRFAPRLDCRRGLSRYHRGRLRARPSACELRIYFTLY